VKPANNEVKDPSTTRHPDRIFDVFKKNPQRSDRNKKTDGITSGTREENKQGRKVNECQNREVVGIDESAVARTVH